MSAFDEERAMPPRVEGRWMNCSDENATLAGCKTCGWQIQGRYEDVKQPWIDHTHDPLHDIEARAFSDAATPKEDVLYLLDLLDEMDGITP